MKKEKLEKPDTKNFLHRMMVKKEAREKARLSLAKTPEDILQQTKLMIPWEALDKDQLRHDLTPNDKIKLMEALLFYARNNQSCIHPEQFITECTELPLTFFSDSIEQFPVDEMNEKDRREIKLACRLLSRARGVCEQNIATYHTKTNPQFAAFYLKNRYGYIDKTEQKTELSGGQKIEIIMHLPEPKPLPDYLKVQDNPKLVTG